jgi:Uma2 family endonuclease
MTSAARELRRFTAEEYLHMIAVGILGDGDHVELVDGEVVTMVPQEPEHSALDDELRERLAHAYRDASAFVRDQKPLRCGDYGVPEPDLAVVRGQPRDYISAHPRGSDTLLVVEVAKTSQERDRDKARDYARGDVPVYWLLDLDARALDVYTGPDPRAGRYRALVSLGETDAVTLPELGLSWLVASLLA